MTSAENNKKKYSSIIESTFGHLKQNRRYDAQEMMMVQTRHWD